MPILTTTTPNGQAKWDTDKGIITMQFTTHEGRVNADKLADGTAKSAVHGNASFSFTLPDGTVVKFNGIGLSPIVPKGTKQSKYKYVSLAEIRGSQTANEWAPLYRQ